MAVSPEIIAATYPLPAYNVRVDVDGATISVSEVEGITVERESVAYRHGLSYWEGESFSTYRNNRFRPITLRKGVVRCMAMLHEWLNEGIHAARPMDVHLCDAEGAPAVTWRIAKAIPVKIEAPAFNQADNEVAVETLEIMASGISVEHQ